MSFRSAMTEAIRGRRRVALAAAAVSVAAAVGLAGGELGGMAVRAGAVLLALAVAAVLARRRAIARPGTPAIAVTARQPLGRDIGLALVVAGDRRLLVGYGTGGVTLLAEILERQEARP